MIHEPEHDRRFAAVVAEGTDHAGEVWVALGPDGVARLREELSGEHRVRIPEDVHPKDVLDNLTWASRRIAAAYPDRFPATFASPEWDGNVVVCAGLGKIRRPEVTKRLMRLLSYEDKWIRVQAAVAIRGHRHPGLQSVLLAALDDPEDLVRYHVEERLAELEM